MSTSILIDDALARAGKGDELAKRVAAAWQYPLEIVFLTPAGKLISKLNAFDDLPGVHVDVGGPEKKMSATAHERSNTDVFLNHLAAHFGRD